MASDSHRFAWDGVSFRLPEDWNLARYRYEGKVLRTEFEDDYNQRAVIQWTWPKHTLADERIRKRFQKREKRLAENVEKKRDISGLPKGWKATLYDYGKGNRLVVAYGIQHHPSLFLFLRLYFTAQDHESPQRLTRQLAESIDARDRGIIQWSVYDMQVWLPREFKLVNTVFEAGRKRMAFNNRLQRLCIWQFSIAHLLFKDVEPHAWVAAFLNAQRMFRGPKFMYDEDGNVYAKRTKRHLLGHFDEYGRLSFRYLIGFEYDEQHDRFVLWVYNYRRKKALEQLQKGFPLEFGK